MEKETKDPEPFQIPLSEQTEASDERWKRMWEWYYACRENRQQFKQ